MPDITMCVNTKCALSNKCLRVQSKPSEFQSYAMFHPNQINLALRKHACDKFIPIKTQEKK